MNKDTSSSNRSDLSSAALGAGQLNELGDLVFQVISFCTTEPQFSNYSQLAQEMGVPVGQAVAAAVAGTLLQHYEIRPKNCHSHGEAT